MSCLAWSIGIAKPRPMLPASALTLAMAVEIPTTLPEVSTSGPPELPGLIAASVWTASLMVTADRPPSSTPKLRRDPSTGVAGSKTWVDMAASRRGGRCFRPDLGPRSFGLPASNLGVRCEPAVRSAGRRARVQRQQDPEPGSLPRLAAHLDGPPVGGDQRGDDRQAEPRAASGVRAGRIGPVEALEDPLGLLPGEPSTVVDDLDGGAAGAVAAAGAGPQLDRAAGGRVGERVAHQVGDDLAQPVLVPEDDERATAVAVGAELELDAPVRGDGAGVVDRLGGQRQQVDRAPVERSLLVEAGQEEQVLHQQPHPRRLVLDAAHQPVELAGLEE